MAGEIYIADKTTLDQVKTNTDNILGNFPINGGIDWTKRNTQILSNNVHLNVYSSATLVEIQGKGLIHSIVFNTPQGSMTLGINIDGISKKSTSDKDFGTYSGAISRNYILNIPFNNSAILTATNPLSGSYDAGITVIYSLD